MKRIQQGKCLFVLVQILGLIFLSESLVQSAAMNDYCNVPPFIAQSVPPLVMLDVGRDHKLYYSAYSDAADLDGDGRLDIDYTHYIDYYGYFDPLKCYTYDSTTGRFNPQYTTTDKFCNGTAGHWSGNVLNWLTMSRMDVLRKVLYGGHRSTDSSSETVLERAFITQDAHSWGKELTGSLCNSGSVYKNSCATFRDCESGYSCVDKSMALIGIAGATLPTTCTASAVTGTHPGMLVGRYNHSNSKSCGVGNAQGMINSYEPGNLFRYDYLDGFDANPGGGVPTLTNASNTDDFNILVVTKFIADVTGVWSFAVDGDDDVEVQISNPLAGSDSIVAQYLGCHGFAGNQTYSGTISLTAGTEYTLIARHFEKSGGEGIQVWFKKPAGATWNIVNRANLPSLKAPDITAGNTCAIKTVSFVANGTLGTGSVLSSLSGNQHLFCGTTLNSSTDPPVLRLLTNKSNRIWDWAAKERPVCDESLGTPTNYTTRVKVCDSSIGLEANCKKYGTSYKPTGLLQKYGEGDGSKVCSKTYSTSCTSDIDCGTGKGICIYKAPMYFGLMTGSYMKNESGGVLRKNVSSILDEVDLSNGTLVTTAATGSIIKTFDNMKLVGFNYTSHAYDDTSGGNCGWIVDRTINEGECRNWGNPIGEMMYETLRYFAGKNVPTSEFNYYTYTGTYPPSPYSPPNDSGLDLSLPVWGFTNTASSTRLKPYEAFPTCSKPFMLILSDINPSYDSDQIPGSTFAKTDGTFFSEDTLTPQLDLGPHTVTGTSLLNSLADIIGTDESVPSNNWYIGESNSVYDTLCTAKASATTASFSLMRGLCPEEPTKRGSYYAAALAYFGKTQFATKASLTQNVTTYSVALSSPVADLKVKAGSNYVTFIPTGKSVSGSGINTTCASRCTTKTLDANGLHLTGCNTTTPAAYCPTNQIVNFFADDMRYNASKDVIYARFRVNFEDVEQGADHDMDSIISYEICTADAVTLHYGTCVTALAASELEVKVSSDYGAGGYDQVLGFIISGTTADATYLVVKDADVSGKCYNTSDNSDAGTTCYGTNLCTATQYCGHDGDTPDQVAGLGLKWSKKFTVNTSASAANFLKNPLWYAAKWGGFVDSNPPLSAAALATYVPKPDLVSEWAKEDGVNPDNYFLVVNPLKLETQLNKALTSILARVSSGTASSILNNSEGSGANLLQAVFYPEKDFGGANNKVAWIGEMQNLWYFVDPFFNRSTVRVDSNSDFNLDLNQDYIAKFRFDTGTNKTVVDLAQDVNGDGTSLTAIGTYSSDDSQVKSLWRAGRKLWERNVTSDPRKIYTVTTSTAMTTPTLMLNDGVFNAVAANITLLQAADSTAAGKIIDFVQGKDTGLRSRKVTISGCGLTDAQGCAREWKLGDIVNSTPRLVTSVNINNYSTDPPAGYGDASYGKFKSSYNYKHRGMAFVGGNDGMLHGFRLGVLSEAGQTKQHKGKLLNIDGTTADASSDLGREEWAFIPRNALPYLAYTAETNYSHLYFVDNTVSIFDASINAPSDNNGTAYPNCGTNYFDCGKKTAVDASNNLDMAKTSWRTVLIGGMGIGGASRDSTTPTSATAGGCDDKVSTGTCVKTPITGAGYSSYFALDVTNPHLPFDDADTVNRSKFLWEFSGDPANGDYLGYSTSGPAVVRVGPKDKNGRWLAVFASGPTGPIDTSLHSFNAKSNQRLKLFVVDIATGTLLRTINTGIDNAFAGTISNAVIDSDKWNKTSTGFYSDDAIYIGYTTTADANPTAASVWNKGGIIRLFTKESTNPTDWVFSTVIDNIGPVTTSVAKLQDRFAYYDKSKTNAATGKLWLYFGSGRYFQKSDSLTEPFKIYGLIEPCYSTNVGSPNFTPTGANNKFDTTCTTAVTEANMTNQTGNASTAPAANLPLASQGWYINLDPSVGGFGTERSVTNAVTSTAGAVFFTTYKPTSDICEFGGSSNVWALRYDSGGVPPAAAMQGKVLMQVSTGALAEISLATAFKSSTGNLQYDGRRTDVPISGMPPTNNGLALITNPKAVKKILHYQEK